ncbi:MAG: hypothetical protein MUC35_05445 [Candidatus Margulisbacteria bacterium]|nr:hypothetical protein [Candidatus Margulisiibacteriota bacterium]
MSADTAIYYDRPLANTAIKTIYSKKLNLGTSCYGIWTHDIEENGQKRFFEMNTVVGDFIAEFENKYKGDQISLMANELAERINKFFNRCFKKEEIGFHLAGYEASASGTLPAVFHIVVQESTGKLIAQPEFHENDKWFSHKEQCNCENKKEFLDKNIQFEIRNGDWEVFAGLKTKMKEYFDLHRASGRINFPYIRNLDDLGDYAAFSVQMMTEIYRQSDRGQTIGGPINTITFNDKGLNKQFFRISGDYPIEIPRPKSI